MKVYRKPQLIKVKLLTEEAVLQVCKGLNAFGPSAPNCVTPTEHCLGSYGPDCTTCHQWG